jgi:large subunit ribosomal protein L31
MKKNIHPTVYETVIVCATCGTQWPQTSTRNNMRVDVCAKCHPYYTGEQRIVDTAGQVDRFMRRLRTSQVQQAEAAKRRDDKAVPVAPKKPSLLKEIYGDDA